MKATGKQNLQLVELLKQHITSSATTGHSPAKLMFGRTIKTILDTLKPRSDEEDNYVIVRKGVKLREIELGSKVRMRNYRSSGPKWTTATVGKKLGNRNYIVKENDTGVCHKRHRSNRSNTTRINK